MFSAEKPLPHPPLPPKPQKGNLKILLATARRSEDPPPVPPHRGSDENENLSVTVSAQDIKKGARTVVAAVGAFEKSKYGPTIVKQIVQNGGGAVKPSVPVKPPFVPKNQAASNGPTVVRPQKNDMVTSTRKKFEAKTSRNTVNVSDSRDWENTSSSNQKPTIIRPSNVSASVDVGGEAKSVKALRDQLQDKIIFGKPTIVDPARQGPASCMEVRQQSPSILSVKRKTPPPRPPSPAKHTPPDSVPVPRATARFDFIGENFDELSCMVGDTILLKKVVDESWYYGANTRTEQNGIVPKNFLNVIMPLVAGPILTEDQNTLIDSTYSHGPRVYTLYDYKSDQGGDLTFCHGEIIRLLSRLNLDWLEGETGDGRKGIFPASYVEIFEDLPNHLNKMPLQEPKNPSHYSHSTVHAVFDYCGSSHEDLTFKTGDSISVSGKLNADWLWGCLSEQPSNSGMFPASFVDKVPFDLPVMDLPITPGPEISQETGCIGKIAVAVYDYHSEDRRDLYFFSGDKITVTGEEGPDWLRGKLFGSKTVPEGLFPRNYVQFE